MKKLLLLILLTITIPSLTKACLWLEGTTIDGEYKTFEDKTISSIFLKNSQHITAQQNFEQKFYRDNNQTTEYLALKAIIQGNYNEGIERLLQIEKQNQMLYSTASNLGTAYELKGDNSSAIQWIKEGIKRDSNSHYGTEWLHLLILKSKLQLESNATLLNNRHIINLPKHFDETTSIKIKEKNYSIKEIRDALFYQLKERLIFLKPKDVIVADLLYSFAKIEEQTTVIEEAEHLVNMAIDYGFNNQNEIILIKNHIHATRTSYTLKLALYGVGVVFLLAIFSMFRKKKEKDLIKKPLSPLSFALSVNAHILLFAILFIPFYDFIFSYFKHISILYITLIPFYILAILLALQGLKKDNIISKPTQSILFTILLYLGFILTLYFKFLQDAHSNLTAYFLAHTLLAIGIFYFLKWRMKI